MIAPCVSAPSARPHVKQASAVASFSALQEGQIIAGRSSLAVIFSNGHATRGAPNISLSGAELATWETLYERRCPEFGRRGSDCFCDLEGRRPAEDSTRVKPVPRAPWEQWGRPPFWSPGLR